MAARDDDLHSEVLRLRDRMHAMQSDLAGLRFRVDDGDKWREHIAPIIEDLREADRIAEAVARKMSENTQTALTKDSLRLTTAQAWAAIGAVVLTGAGLVMQALGAAGAL